MCYLLKIAIISKLLLFANLSPYGPNEYLILYSTRNTKQDYNCIYT